MSKEVIYPHGDIVQLATNLWCVEGTIRMPLGALKRNMVIYRLPNRDLLIHSAVALDDAGMKGLEALGRPAYLVVPHGGHRLDAGFYKKRYPAIKVIAPAAARAKIEQVIKADATAEEALPALGIGVHKVEGMKPAMGENVLAVDVDGGKALIVNDIMGGGFGGPKNFLMRVLGPPGPGLGIPRVVRWVAIADKASVKTTLGKLAAIPNLKILTISHGPPLLEKVAEGIRTAAAQL
jgi:hypothetical protein